MISAKEAARRSMRDAEVKHQMTKIESAITEATNSREKILEIMVSFSDIKELHPDVSKELDELGYKVELTKTRSKLFCHISWIPDDESNMDV